MAPLLKRRLFLYFVGQVHEEKRICSLETHADLMSKGDKLCTGEPSAGGRVGVCEGGALMLVCCYFKRKLFDSAGDCCIHHHRFYWVTDLLLTSAADTNESVEAMLMLSLRQASSRSVSSTILSVIIEGTRVKNWLWRLSFVVGCGVGFTWAAAVGGGRL